MWVVVHRTYEAATRYAYPVVEHRFYGRTREEAEGYYRAHQRADAFIRGCTERGRYQDVTCRTTVEVHQIA